MTTAVLNTTAATLQTWIVPAGWSAPVNSIVFNGVSATLSNVTLIPGSTIYYLQNTHASGADFWFNDLNLITQSQVFNDGTWYENAVTCTTAQAAPDGSATATKLVETATTDYHVISSAAYTKPGAAYPITGSVYVKYGGRRITVELYGASSLIANAIVDLVDNYLVVLAGTTLISAYLVTDSLATGAAGNGWYRCIVTATSDTTTSVLMHLTLDNGTGNAAASNDYLGDGASGAYIWGAQLNYGTTAKAYTPTTTAAKFSEYIANASGTPSSISISWIDQGEMSTSKTPIVSPVEARTQIVAEANKIYIGKPTDIVTPNPEDILNYANTVLAGYDQPALTTVPAPNEVPSIVHALHTDAKNFNPANPAACGYNLIFFDDFLGTALDTTKWTPTWVVADQQPAPYTNLVSPGANSQETAWMDSANVSVANSKLSILLEAKSQTIDGLTLANTGGMIQSWGFSGTSLANAHFVYSCGYVEAYINFPAYGSGSPAMLANWPAFWQTGREDVVWPYAGEIDIAEIRTGYPSANYHSWSAQYGPNDWQDTAKSHAIQADYTGWHYYGALWTPNQIIYYYDRVPVATCTKEIVTALQYIIIANTTSDSSEVLLPTTLQADWVKVWRKPSF